MTGDPRLPHDLDDDPREPGSGRTHGGLLDRSVSRWVSLQARAMAEAWERGERVTAAEVLEGRPGLDAEAIIRLIYEEVCLRRDAGLETETTEVVRRYPQWSDELRALFDCDRLLRASGAIAAFPEVGEALGPFRLLAELGRGASGRTFLATDPALADRPVVVKVVPDNQEEHLALARLQHTHIVPLFSEHTFPERGLRVLCMPYLGGASLAQILGDMAEVPLSQRSGRLLAERIDRNTRTGPSPFEAPFRRALEQASYVQAVTWIGACLADALHYAHARGLVHMDVKPSNVLIAADGQPMLLDFHLARAPIAAGERVDRLGGTPGWMSPEQRAAMEAIEAGRPVPAAVDERTDIFALGLLLREALAPKGPGRGLAAVGVGLSDILRKCTAPHPADRYRDAASLAEDLRRHLGSLPLKGVRNRSLPERWRKWRRRNPGTLGWLVGGLVTVAAAAGALALAAADYRQRVGEILVVLEDARRDRSSGHYEAAIRTLTRARQGAASSFGVGELSRALDDELRLARRGRMAAELHELADRIRFQYGIDLPSREGAHELLRHCLAVWQRRDRLIDVRGASLGASSEERIQADLLELAAIQADLRVRLAGPGDREEARREALGWLEEVDARCGPSLTIDRRRAALADPLGDAAEAGTLARPPRTPWEHDDLGRYYLRSGRLELAALEFRRALRTRPQDFWPNFYQGLCAFRMHQPEEAAAAFRTCIALRPQSAICHYNRGRSLEALGRTDEAFEDYSAAVELDSALAPAYLNRGILSYKGKRPLEAISDFEHALGTRPEPETRGRLLYNLALARLARGERETALHCAEEAAALGCAEAGPLADEIRKAPAAPAAAGERDRATQGPKPIPGPATAGEGS